jgi:hypothetical protein
MMPIFKVFLTELRTSKTLIYQRRQGLFHQMNTTLAVMERTQQIERQLHQLFAERRKLKWLIRFIPLAVVKP